MKILLDSCVAKIVKVALINSGHDVIWIGDCSIDPGDNEIIAQAEREKRILITLDKDFGELVVVSGVHHHGILRLVNFSARQQALASEQLLSQYAAELNAGALITAEPGHVRIRQAHQLQ